MGTIESGSFVVSTDTGGSAVQNYGTIGTISGGTFQGKKGSDLSSNGSVTTIAGTEENPIIFSGLHGIYNGFVFLSSKNNGFVGTIGSISHATLTGNDSSCRLLRSGAPDQHRPHPGHDALRPVGLRRPHRDVPLRGRHQRIRYDGRHHDGGRTAREPDLAAQGSTALPQTGDQASGAPATLGVIGAVLAALGLGSRRRCRE